MALFGMKMNSMSSRKNTGFRSHQGVKSTITMNIMGKQKAMTKYEIPVETLTLPL